MASYTVSNTSALTLKDSAGSYDIYFIRNDSSKSNVYDRIISMYAPSSSASGHWSRTSYSSTRYPTELGSVTYSYSDGYGIEWYPSNTGRSATESSGRITGSFTISLCISDLLLGEYVTSSDGIHIYNNQYYAVSSSNIHTVKKYSGTTLTDYTFYTCNSYPYPKSANCVEVYFNHSAHYYAKLTGTTDTPQFSMNYDTNKYWFAFDSTVTIKSIIANYGSFTYDYGSTNDNVSSDSWGVTISSPMTIYPDDHRRIKVRQKEIYVSISFPENDNIKDSYSYTVQYSYNNGSNWGVFASGTLSTTMAGVERVCSTAYALYSYRVRINCPDKSYSYAIMPDNSLLATAMCLTNANSSASNYQYYDFGRLTSNNDTYTTGTIKFYNIKACYITRVYDAGNWKRDITIFNPNTGLGQFKYCRVYYTNNKSYSIDNSGGNASISTCTVGGGQISSKIRITDRGGFGDAYIATITPVYFQNSVYYGPGAGTDEDVSDDPKQTMYDHMHG